MCKKITLLFLFVVSISFGQVDFTKHLIENNLDGSGHSWVGDLDGDGDLDIVTGTGNDDEVLWFENDGNQNFTKHIVLSNHDGAFTVSVTDFDNDGDLDIRSWAIYTGGTAYLVNDGNQNYTKQTASQIVGLSNENENIYLTNDFNGDGIKNFADFFTSDTTITWYNAVSPNTFVAHTVSKVQNVYNIAGYEDLDGDKDLDVIVRDTLTNDEKFLRNENGTSFTVLNASFPKRVPGDVYYDYVPSLSEKPNGIGDIDNDGDIDLIGVSPNLDRVNWYENDGNNNYTQHNIDSIGDYPINALIIDINNDGYKDIIAAIYFDDQIVSYINDGNQNFTKQILDTGIDGPNGLFAIDLDKDGDDDLIINGALGDDLTWLENKTFTPNVDNYVYQSPILGNRNYVYTMAPQKAITTLDSIKINGDVIESVSYIDGLGRPIQQVAMRAGGKGEDLITPIIYDNLGRQVKDYLPYATGSNTGEKFHSNIENEINTFYKNKYAGDFGNTIEAEINAYSEKAFEASPLNRVLEQAAPGDSWRLDNNHTIKFEYQTNVLLDSVRFFDVTFVDSLNTEAPSLIETGFYGLGELYKTVTKDENWQPSQTHINDHTTEEFKDKQGMVVLKRTYNENQWHDTYYVYDDYNNLTYVIPPKAADEASISQTILDALCYQYKYDYRNRLIEKKIPGKGWESIVYDNLDRPVLTQDANLNELNVWLFTKYDAFGRVVYTGKYTDINNDRLDLQAIFDAKSATNNYEERGSSTLVADYTNIDFPSTDLEILTINYYDDYSFSGAPFNPTSNPETVFNTTTSIATRSLATGSKVKVLDVSPAKWITTVTYYDEKARPIYVHSNNDFLNTVDIVKNELDFTGRVLKTRASHINNNNSEPEIVTLDTFTYDQMGRVLKQVQCIGGSDLEDDCGAYGANGIENTLVTSETVNPGTSKAIEASDVVILKPGFVAKPVAGQTVEVKINTQAGTVVGSQVELIAENTYDELGQLTKKKVGNTESVALQQVDYTYNVRGWLSGINNENASIYAITKPTTDLFAFQINYDKLVGGTALYNGNISKTIWETESDNSVNTNPVSTEYNYGYDALNRIVFANDNTGNYKLNNVSYDKNGNIMTLDRGGFKNTTDFSDMDILTYGYNAGNQLKSVADAGDVLYGFKDGNKSSDDYDYDDNGNMITDANKGITNINYNHLNLPTTVTINGQNISYVYDAVGAKLRKTVNGTTTDYAGNYVYEKPQSGSPMLQFFNHPEGYVTPEQSSFKYVYQYKDHLGNIRLSYTNIDSVGINLEIIEENNYYPFGLKHKGYNSVTGAGGNSVANKFKYNGKELNEELGLDWYDYGARNYDASLGRWMNLDPLAEQMRRHSPYNYAFDNPVYFIDPDGMIPCPPDDPDCGNEGKADETETKPTETKPKQRELNWFQKGARNMLFTFLSTLNFVGSNGRDDFGTLDLVTMEKGFFRIRDEAVVGSTLGPIAKAIRLPKGSQSSVSQSDEAVDLGNRAKQIHSALKKGTQTRTTTAVAEVSSSDGTRSFVVGFSEKQLRPAQRAVLKPNEVAAVGAGHAEVTAINTAINNGQRVLRVGASRPICSGCMRTINSVGARADSPLKQLKYAIMPPLIR